MNSELETRMRAALVKAKPLIEAVVADLEREAALIKERDLDPRKLAEEPRVQEARDSAVDALAHLSGFARSLDSLIKTYAEDIDQRVDVDRLREQIAGAPAAGRAYFEEHNGHDVATRIESTGEDARAKIVAEAELSRLRAEELAQKSKEEAEAAAHKAKESTKEMLAALGWLTAAGAVIYIFLKDGKRRRQATSVAKAAGSGLLIVANSASKKA